MKNNGSQDQSVHKLLMADDILQDFYENYPTATQENDPLSELIRAHLSHRAPKQAIKKAYDRILHHYGDWQGVMSAPLEQLAQLIDPVGFPQEKAKRIQQTLRLIYEAADGQLSLDFLDSWSVSRARRWLEQLPGVGAKTSAITLNFSKLRKPALVVDANHHRVVERLGIIPQKVRLDKAGLILANMLPQEWDGHRVFRHHYLFQLHGKRLCLSRKPKCQECPLKMHCLYFRRQPGAFEV